MEDRPARTRFSSYSIMRKLWIVVDEHGRVFRFPGKKDDGVIDTGKPTDRKQVSK